MKIKIIGPGCANCHNLYKKVLKLKEEGKINAEIEHITDVNKLIELGVMGSPALVVDDEVVSVGMPESEEKLLSVIKKSSK
ncbi:MAG: thioredoxin family protein [Candidatus Pacearchaeota archaeon]